MAEAEFNLEDVPVEIPVFVSKPVERRLTYSGLKAIERAREKGHKKLIEIEPEEESAFSKYLPPEEEKITINVAKGEMKRRKPKKKKKVSKARSVSPVPKKKTSTKKKDGTKKDGTKRKLSEWNKLVSREVKKIMKSEDGDQTQVFKKAVKEAKKIYNKKKPKAKAKSKAKSKK